MKLKDVKKLIDEWSSVGDWDDAELKIYDSDGYLLIPEKIGLECSQDQTKDGRDVLRFSL